jgi:hypothetical protein
MTGRAEQHDVSGFGQEGARGQGGDLLADRGLGVEVEVLEGLARGEPPARIRRCAPQALRAETSRSRTAAR